MEGVINNGICRCCASEGTFKDVKTKYQWMGEEEIYSDMLKDCFDITLSTTANSDEGGICEVCITQLRNAHNFKKQVLHTEEQFRKRLQEQLFQSKVVKIEVSKEADDDESDTNLSDDYALTEYKVDVKQESREESPKPRKRVAKPPAKPTTSKAKKVKVEDGESSKKSKQRLSIKINETASEKDTIKVKSTVRNKSVRSTSVKESKKHQENLRNILQYSNASLIRCKENDGYRCNFCPKRFALPNDLKCHFLDEHNNVQLLRLPKLFEYLLKLDITDLKCKVCEKTFEKLDDFTVHLKNEHKKDMYTDINSQIIPFKFNSEILRCAICETEFTNFKILQEHMHVHFRNYVCDVCNAGFITKRLLVGHKRRHGIGSYKCSHCEKTFNCDTYRRDHEQRIHLGLKRKNKCKFCDEKFADYWTKIDHMVKVHGAPPVVLNCQACDRKFDNKRALTRHVKKDHLMERKHVCSVCDMRFYLKHRLKEHMVVHTGLKKFQCHVCTRWYGTKKTLRQHLRCHADDRRFSCSTCGQAFVQKCTLRSHMRLKHDIIV